MVGRGSALCISALFVALFLLSVAPPAAAQSGEQNGTGVCAGAESIDYTLELCDAELDGDDAVLTFRSDRDQAVTISDAGAFSNGGEVPTRDVQLEANGTTTVRFPVTETSGGKAGVGIRTDRALFSVVLKDERVLLGGPWTANDARVAALAAALASGFGAAVTVLRRRRGDGGDPRRIA